MSAPTKKKRELHRTPAGIAIYPRLNKPDFKYKKEQGEYSVKLKLTAAEAEPLIALVTAETEKDYKATCAKEEKTKLKRSPNIPFKAEEDDQEKPTGFVIFSFKLPGSIKKRDTGEIIPLKPALFDKAGNKVEADIWGGSTLKVAFEMRPYYTEGLGHGMTLQVKAVQVIKLVTRGEGSADQFGFEVEAPEAEADDTEDGEEESGDAKAKGNF